MTFKQTLSKEEQERYAYISGDTKLSNALIEILELELNEEDLEDTKSQLHSAESDLNNANDEIDKLENKVIKLEDELLKYKQAFNVLLDSVKGYND